MRQRTELSERPPVFTVTQEGTNAVIRFYTDAHETERDEGTVWEAVEWANVRPWSENLEARIAENPGLWFEKIKEIIEKEEAAAELLGLEADVMTSLPDMVLDIDYRLAKMELGL